MNWAAMVIMIALVLSLGAIIAYFMTEGFTTPSGGPIPNTGLPDADTVCMAFSSCSECTDDTKHPGTRCGWCPAASACIPRSGMYRIIPSWLIDIIRKDPTKDCVASDFKYSKGQCSDDTCSDYSNCRDCAGSLACGWCTVSNQCMSKAAVAAAAAAAAGSPPPCIPGGSGGSGGSSCPPPPKPMCGSSSTSFVTQSGTCPPPVCSSITDCSTCTNTTGCGYCKDSMKCISVDGNGVSLGGSSGSTGCAQGSIYTQGYQCPCSTMTKCTDCAARPGCGYCKTTSKCLTTESTTISPYGNTQLLPIPPEQIPCAQDKIATSAPQCTGPITVSPRGRLAPADSEGSGLNPYHKVPGVGAARLGMAQTTLLGGNELNVPPYSGATGAGGGAVSPPKTSKYVSGNGVVRPYGASGARPNGANTTGINDSPLESYVKMLVSSELSSQGIPTNEPFQVNEKQAPGNADNFLKKSLNTIIKGK